MGFSNQRKLLRWFLACVLLGCFHNFSLDPYYEPLSWFMINQRIIIGFIPDFSLLISEVQVKFLENYIPSFAHTNA